MGVVDEWIGTFEGAYTLGSVIDEARLDVLQYLDVAFYLQITETIIGEAGMPRLFAFTFQDIGVVVWASRLFLVTELFRGQCFCWGYLQVLSTLSLYSDFWVSCQVLSHIIHQNRILADCLFDRVALHQLDGGCYLLAQQSLGRFLDDYRFPLSRFYSGVVVLAPIDAVEHDGRGSPLPIRIAQQSFAHPVFIDDVEEETESRGTERDAQLMVSSALLVVEPVA